MNDQNPIVFIISAIILIFFGIIVADRYIEKMKPDYTISIDKDDIIILNTNIKEEKK